MRVIAGNLGGRIFDAPKSRRTHPMADRVRGGLFGILGDIEDLSLLDAFAGSGAISIEALSRGAKRAVAIDIDKNAYETIKKNIKNLGLIDKLKAVNANVSGWSDNNSSEQFDIVVAAPPYDDLQPKIVNKLTVHLKADGIFVLDWPGGFEAPNISGLKLIKQKGYGDAQLVFYKKTE